MGNRKYFHLMHLNTQSTKRDHLTLLADKNFNILCLSEHWHTKLEFMESKFGISRWNLTFQRLRWNVFLD